MESEVKRTQRDYTLAFKLAVVDQVEKGELSYKEAQHRYGIQGRSTVLTWMRKHGRSVAQRASWSALGVPMRNVPIPLTPEQRIKQLEVQLRDATQKAEFFETVVNVLKKDYGVTVKKSLGRSSRKSSSKA